MDSGVRTFLPNIASCRGPERVSLRPVRAGKDLRTRDDIGVRGVFAPMMADAADRRHKQQFELTGQPPRNRLIEKKRR